MFDQDWKRTPVYFKLAINVFIPKSCCWIEGSRCCTISTSPSSTPTSGQPNILWLLDTQNKIVFLHLGGIRHFSLKLKVRRKVVGKHWQGVRKALIYFQIVRCRSSEFEWMNLLFLLETACQHKSCFGRTFCLKMSAFLQCLWPTAPWLITPFR